MSALVRSEIFRLFVNTLTPDEHSEKKEEYPSLIITEIIASERNVYLSV